MTAGRKKRAQVVRESSSKGRGKTGAPQPGHLGSVQQERVGIRPRVPVVADGVHGDRRSALDVEGRAADRAVSRGPQGPLTLGVLRRLL